MSCGEDFLAAGGWSTIGREDAGVPRRAAGSMICVAAMVKLRRLLMEKYRIVKPGTELSFNDGYNVLLGINGTGKTTLLNLIAMCLSASFPGLEEEEFALKYELTIPEGSLQVHVRHQRIESDEPLEPIEHRKPNLASSVDLEFSSQTEAWKSFRLSLSQGRLSLDGELLNPTRTVEISLFEGESFVTQMFARSELLTRSRKPRPRFVVLGASFEQRQAYCRFDEAAEWLKEVLNEGSLTLISLDDGPVGQWKLKRMAAPLVLAMQSLVADRTQPSADLPQAEVFTFRHHELPFLAQAVRSFNFENATLHLELESVERYPTRENHFSKLLTFGNLRFFFTKQDGSRLPLDRLSFGQKRLVAFYYYLATYHSVLIADELANGMHHAMIDDCLQAAGERQKFLATQNPLLIDHVPLGSAQEVRSTFIRCSLATDGPREQMVWSSLTEEESTEFFKDYEVGIQHTNDILRLRGLW